jgi:putative ABC transport system ATP-binding protein
VLGLYEHQNKLPHELSGGQQQRTSIGRAVIKNPEFLLCDEPTGALDYRTSKDILGLLEDINEKYGTTILMVTHNDALAHMADHIVRIKDGEILSDQVNKKVSIKQIEW